MKQEDNYVIIQRIKNLDYGVQKTDFFYASAPKKKKMW